MTTRFSSFQVLAEAKLVKRGLQQPSGWSSNVFIGRAKIKMDSRVRGNDVDGVFGRYRKLIAFALLLMDSRVRGNDVDGIFGTYRKLIAFALLLLLSNSFAIAADRDLRLPEHLQQGQFVIGHAPRGAKIEYAGRRLHIGADGVFVFGLERDAPAQSKLHVRYANGKAQDHAFSVSKREYHIERISGLPQKTVTPDAETTEKIRKEIARVTEAKRHDDAREDFLQGFSLPVEGARISGVYGSQRIDNGVPQSAHVGLDMAVPTGTPVHAPAPGIVTLAEADMILTGGTVLIDHGFGLTSSIIHMSRLDVKLGDKIAAGQLIGLSGATGRASGPHVHWGFSWFDVRLDPALLPKPADR